MKNHEFQELVDQNLSGLVWDERKRQKVLHAISEEEKPVKKITTTFVLIAAIVCLSVTALAAGLIFNGRVDAAKLAENALLEKYHISSEMLSFFHHTVDENDGSMIVSYEGNQPYTFVLGTYRVTVSSGKADASWNWDGTETSRGFDGVAWGAEQLEEMCRVSRETNDLSSYYQKARELAAAHNADSNTDTLDEATKESIRQRAQRDAEIARNKAKYSVAEMEEFAREALSMRYGFTAEQGKCVNNVEDNGRYLLLGDDNIPCYEFFFALGYDDDGYIGPDTGIYYVTVNVENGTIEDMAYDAALDGNG